MIEIICADARDALKDMPERSVHTCVTSPPYWGLRDYGLEPVVWGPECEHEWAEVSYQRRSNDGGEAERKQETNVGAVGRDEPVHHAFCWRCNAWRGALGLEPTPELYVEHLVEVMREVRRVLRDDGTLWLNLGDSYAGGSGTSGGDGSASGLRRDGRPELSRMRSNIQDRKVYVGETPIKRSLMLKPKDLCGIPWRVAFALQADGWWLRSDIVWSKPNPMPESVRDRPTRSHEYVFLLSKSARYHYDAEAIREDGTSGPSDLRKMEESKARIGGLYKDSEDPLAKASSLTNIGQKRAVGSPHRNRRSVWEIATQPYPGAHFAVFPEKLVEPCILAGCPEGGTVLDPFAGSGTAGLVAERLGRHSVLIDASEDYCRMARERTAQRGLMIGR